MPVYPVMNTDVTLWYLVLRYSWAYKCDHIWYFRQMFLQFHFFTSFIRLCNQFAWKNWRNHFIAISLLANLSLHQLACYKILNYHMLRHIWWFIICNDSNLNQFLAISPLASIANLTLNESERWNWIFTNMFQFIR